MGALNGATRAEPRWDIDAAVGHQGELWVSDIRRALVEGTIEVKRDRRVIDTGNVFVEYECLRRGKWCKSGLATTRAELWIFVLLHDELAIVLTTDSLRRVAGEAYRDPRNRKPQLEGSHPTRGVIVSVTQLIAGLLRDARRTTG